MLTVKPVKPILIIDTEGSPLLTQVSVINLAGTLVYEATTPDFPTANTWRANLCSRPKLLSELTPVISGHRLVSHFAKHDLKVLQSSYKQVGLNFPPVEWICTYELAKVHFPKMNSYSLSNLARQLHLNVNGKRFDSNQAHSARYDALFTRQLYLIICNQKQTFAMKNSPNPFSSSRVDNPFQNHPDFEGIYRVQFQILAEIIQEIHLDPNHQSKGSVVIGEPGSGKTHLMMRLAQRLRSNRLFFIRQPNNPQAVQYHIYSRILESLLEKVPGSTFTQLEYLFANTLIRIFLNSDRSTSKLRQNLTGFLEDPLALFTKLGGDNTEQKREHWKSIERITLKWWQETYSSAGSAYHVLQGFIKYCGYSDPRRRKFIMQWLAANELPEDELKMIGLNPWSETLSREEFALEAISTIAKLSVLDEPLIIIFDQLEALFLEHNRQLLLNFGEAVKEIFTHAPNSLIILNLFPDRWEQFQDIFDGSVVGRASQHQVVLERPNDDQLKQILAQKAGGHLDELFTDQEQNLILQGNSIRNIINRAGDYYRYKFKGIPLPPALKPFVSKPQHLMGESPDRIHVVLVSIQRQLQHISAHLGIQTRPESEEEGIDLAEPETDLPDLQTVPSQVLVIRDYVQAKRQTLEADYEKPRIVSDHDDIGKLWHIAHAFQNGQDNINIDLDTLSLGKRALPDHLLCIVNGKQTCIGFSNSDGNSFTSRIQNWNQLVIQNSNIQFELYRDARQSVITGKVGKAEIEKLINAKNGNFQVLERSQRIDFDLVSDLITDINNRDLEVEMSECLKVLRPELAHCFVFRILG